MATRFVSKKTVVIAVGAVATVITIAALAIPASVFGSRFAMYPHGYFGGGRRR